MIEKFIFIKKVDLNNNCPNCYCNDGLKLTCNQKIKETIFYKAVTAEMNFELACNNCKSNIYPVDWSDEIERVFEYHNKSCKPLKPSTQLKQASWLAIIAISILAISIVSIIIYSQL
ncbi:hypothetical protein [Mariniflexile sp.]|uniref:hypothetical protein n=1 Tax=Mariniflexile sp. TaxID=1979402 RepID=UPI003569FB38